MQDPPATCLIFVTIAVYNVGRVAKCGAGDGEPGTTSIVAHLVCMTSSRSSLGILLMGSKELVINSASAANHMHG